MRVKGLNRILYLGVTIIIYISMISCFDKSTYYKENIDEAVELNIYMIGELNNIDKVIEKFENETRDTLNIKLNIKAYTFAEYKEKIPLMLSTGEDIDLVFDAYWLNLSKMVSEGVYADLSDYFNNSEYPGLKSAFSEEYLNDNAINGSTYAVPFTQYYEDLRGIYIRKDLREKYNLDEIKNLNDFEEYLKVILKNETDLEAPFGITGRRGFQEFDKDYEGKDNNSIVIAGTPFTVRISQDGKNIVRATMLGDDDSYFTVNESPYNIDLEKDRLVNRLQRWVPYVQSNAHVESDAYNNLFKFGKVAAIEGTISLFAKYQQEIERNIPRAEIEFFPYSQEQLEMKEGAIQIYCQTAWNFLAIPEASENKDEVMKFLNWIFESQENHDLFEFGIEGEDWKKVGDNEYEILNSDTQYQLPGYELTWNPNFVRIEASLPQYIKEYLNYSKEESSYMKNPLAGFILNTIPVKTEIAAITAIENKYETLLITGILGDKTEEIIQKYYAELISAGANKVRDEVIKQVTEFLDNK